MKFDELFPHVKHSLEDFMFDEEGNIPRSKILAIGSMMIVLSLMLTEKAFAAHRTHSSHRTHSTHRTAAAGILPTTHIQRTQRMVRIAPILTTQHTQIILHIAMLRRLPPNFK